MATAAKRSAPRRTAPSSSGTGRRATPLAFETLTIEGGLLSPDWLARVARVEATSQGDADYGIPRGLALRDEIARYWRIALYHWTEFRAAVENSGPTWTDEHRLATTVKFATALLKGCLGFDSLSKVSVVELEGRQFPLGHAALQGRVPIVMAPAAQGLDTLSMEMGDGVRKRSAFALAQEYLNAEAQALWGIATDGETLRLLRDNDSLTRPAWVAVDLNRMFSEARAADFAAFWLLMHASRFGHPDESPDACTLEAWRNEGREEGTRALSTLSAGVRDALQALGQGFISHTANGPLRDALRDGTLTDRQYFQELLRLVYRIIFGLTMEERQLLHPETATATARELYEKGYSFRRLRNRSVTGYTHDRHHDLWEATRITFRALAKGDSTLGLPALAGIFSGRQTPWLDASRLENRALLTAMHRLAWLRQPSGLTRVNWRDMGPEELGSVYESLLELVPVVRVHTREFLFADADAGKGNARKTSGSYYTPDSLVQLLLDSALEPVIQQTIASHAGDPVDALLRLSIVDPACGSGHFLLAAARHLAGHVARLQAQGSPTVAQYRHAMRQVVGRCIYGVDLNPMAVELCKVALWMEAVEPGLPLSFLDAHIQCGNSLLGATPELMANGVPDVAWEPLDGDQKQVASSLKKRNRITGQEMGGQRTLDALFDTTPADSLSGVAERAARIEEGNDLTVDQLLAKEQAWQMLMQSDDYQQARLVADSWCAAFVWPKEAGPLADHAPVDSTWRQLRDRRLVPPATLKDTVAALAQQYQFFHWHLAFPRVMSQGGFDVVLGNPPWERVKLQEQEFFASRDPEIATAANAAARKVKIARLPQEAPHLWKAWCDASRAAEGQSHFIRQSGRFPLCGKGDVNTYAVFAEHNLRTLRKQGRAGFIVPPGLATDDTTKAYFQELTHQGTLVSLLEFENEEFLFRGIDHRVRFILMTVSGTRVPRAELAFGMRRVAQLQEAERRYSLLPEDFAVLNPNTRTCPTFRSRRDADLNLRMYRRVGVLWDETRADGNPWGLRFMAMFHMANDSGLFRTREQLLLHGAEQQGNIFELDGHRWLPLVEAKMVHHYDHRFGTYEGLTQAGANQGKLPEFTDADHADPNRFTLPEYWVNEREVRAKLLGRWDRGWVMGWRDISNSGNQRTLVASVLPTYAVGHKFPLFFSDREPKEMAVLIALLSSFTVDYAARQKLSGTSMTYFLLKQLPILHPGTFATHCPWSTNESMMDFFVKRVVELTYTAWDVAPFARDLGIDGPPFRWDPARRAVLRAELEAAFFLLYGLTLDDVTHVLNSFPVIRKNEERAFGEYRTRRLILEKYDEMARAMR